MHASGLDKRVPPLSEYKEVKQHRVWLTFGWMTSEVAYTYLQPACSVTDGGSEVTFKY